MADLSQSVKVVGFMAAPAGDFGQQALEWNAFFSTFAQVSGGLVGLVFVALTFNGKLGADGHPAMRDLARQTFSDFLSVLVVSLILLVPRMYPLSTGLFLVLSGALGMRRILRTLLGMWRRSIPRDAGRQVLQRFLLSMLGNSGLLFSGALLFIPEFNGAAFWPPLFSSMIGLLLSGSRSAWLLVMHDPD